MKTTTRMLPLLLCALLALGGAAAAGTIKGRALFSGKAPKRRPLRMTQDEYCTGYYKGKEPPRSDATVVNGDGSLRYVFVYVAEEVKGAPAPEADTVELDQEGCSYSPHVLGMVAGQKLVVKNSDETKHNFHLLGRNKYNRSANPGNSVKHKIRKAGTLEPKKGRSRLMSRIKCDIHPWMAAFVGVLPHPFFAVTGEHGNFAITGLPPGTYTLVAWHEKLGTEMQQVTVPADGEQPVEFTFKAS